MAQDNAWLKIRRLRGAPPRSVRSEWVPLFRAALEQAEAFHRAALVGDTVSPVLFSYCLKQFGTAVVLANGAERLPKGGHGMSRPGGTGEIGDPLDSVLRFKPSKEDGSFARVAAALGDDVVAGEATTRSLIAGNPDAFDLFPSIHSGRPIRLATDGGDEPGGAIHGDDETRPLYPGNDGLRVEVMHPGPSRSIKDFEKMLSSYDVVPGWRVWDPFGGMDYSRTTGSHNGRVIEWRWRSDDSVPSHYSQVLSDKHVTRGYGQRSTLVPKMLSPNAPTGGQWSRFTWWTASMFALDTVARYHPDTWADLVDLDATDEAADIRGFLGLAATAIPEAGLCAIREAVGRA